MRTLLLVLLGGGLLWLVLRSNAAPAAEAHEPVAAGHMLAPEAPASDEPAAGTPADEGAPAPAGQAAEPIAEPAVAPATVSAPPAPPAPAPVVPDAASRQAKSDAPTSTQVSAPSGEVQLAARIVHAPETVEQHVQGGLEGIPAARRQFARALAALALGDDATAAKLAQGLDSESGLKSSEAEFLKRATRGSRTVEAASASESPLLQAGMLALALREARAMEGQVGKAKEACAALSLVMLTELQAPWPVERAAMQRWNETLRRLQAQHRWKRDGDWPYQTMTVERGDSLISLRKRALEATPQLVTCTGLIAKANQLGKSPIHPGQTLRIPTQRVRMLVDLDAHWAFYMAGDEIIEAWEVGVGKRGNETKPGTYYVGEKREEPMWFPPGEQPVAYGDPRNPLGTRWIELRTSEGQPSHLGFHGTNEPDSVGGDTSQGCLRMRNAEVEELFEILPKGTEVLIRP